MVIFYLLLLLVVRWGRSIGIVDNLIWDFFGFAMWRIDLVIGKIVVGIGIERGFIAERGLVGDILRLDLMCFGRYYYRRFWDILG